MPSRMAPTVFVICPFHDPYDVYYEQLLGPTIEATGRVALRADDIFRSGNVVHQVIESIRDAELVVAELSEPNANVYYELGMAHAMAKPCILLTRDSSEIPFDLKNQRHLSYDTVRPAWADDLRSALESAMEATAANPGASVLAPFSATAASGGSAETSRSNITPGDSALSMLQASVDSLREELFTGGFSSRGLVGGVPATASELQGMAAELASRGLSDALIVARLRDRGAPTPWARRVVAELRSP